LSEPPLKALLIYPPFPQTFWSYSYALPLIGKKASLPPLGLLTVAALMPPRWEKRLVDMNVRRLTSADLAWADCVFIGGMAIQREAARQVIARCKAAGKTVVAGGPLFAAEYAFFEQVDHFVLGEAEPVMDALVRDLENGTARRVYRSKEFADLRNSPMPLWSLADLKQYFCVGVQFSRGCPYDCEFCNVTALLGRRPRTKAASQIIAELDALRGAGWRGPVFFVDDNLIGHRPALKNDLLPALVRWQKANGPAAFSTQVSIDLADDEALVRRMVQAGFDAVFVGIETPDQDSLDECRKRQNVDRDLVADVRRLQRAGMEVQAGFIVGFDHDTRTIFQRQVDFIQRTGIVTAMVGMLQAPPGTRLYERLLLEGRLCGRASGDNADGTTNVVPAMGLGALREGYRWLLRHIYSPRAYYQRVRRFLREYRLVGPSIAPDRSRLVAFARSLLRLGLLEPQRRYFWGLLAWTLLRRPKLLPTAVRLAICGHHYRKMSESIA